MNTDFRNMVKMCFVLLKLASFQYECLGNKGEAGAVGTFPAETLLKRERFSVVRTELKVLSQFSTS